MKIEPIKYLKLINEGATLKDKLILFLYFVLNAPINFLRKEKNHKLLGNVKVSSKDGIFVCGRDMPSAWAGSSFYETDLRKFFDIREGVFLDIGANIGKYSIILGKNPKIKVIAFEPTPETFKILKKNIELNKLKNINPINIALGDKEGVADFYLDKEKMWGDLNNSLIAESLIKKERQIKIMVKVRKLDNVLKDMNLDRIDLVKIDVEGGESQVFRGAIKTLKKYHPKIIFEAWDKEKLQEVENIIKPIGYVINEIASENYMAIKESKNGGNKNAALF